MKSLHLCFQLFGKVLFLLPYNEQLSCVIDSGKQLPALPFGMSISFSVIKNAWQWCYSLCSDSVL